MAKKPEPKKHGVPLLSELKPEMIIGKSDKVTWAIDPVAVSRILAAGSTYHTRMVKRSLFDLEGSKNRNARPDRQYEPDRALSFGLLMLEDEALFTSPVGYFMADGRIDILGGVHRLGGATEAKVPEVGVLLVPSDNIDVIERLREGLNDYEGVRNTPIQTKLNAKLAVEKHGDTPEKAARAHGLPVGSFIEWLRGQKVLDVLQERGVTLGDTVKSEHLKILARLDRNHVVLEAAARLVSDAQFVVKITREFVSDICKAKSEAAMLMTVGRWSQDYEETQTAVSEAKAEAKGPVTRTEVTRRIRTKSPVSRAKAKFAELRRITMAWCNFIDKLPSETPAVAGLVVPAEFKPFIATWRKAVKRFERIVKRAEG